MSFESTVRNVNKVAVVDLSGELTLGPGSDAMRFLVVGLLENGERRILLNCQQLAHVDSAGLGEMMSCHTTAQRRGGTIKLAGARDRLAVLLKLTGLDRVVESFPDESSAVASFEASRLEKRSERNPKNSESEGLLDIIVFLCPSSPSVISISRTKWSSCGWISMCD